MTDNRKLLELAAKAAGIDVGPDDFRDEIGRKYTSGLGLWVRLGQTESGEWWNPLEDDGDALRLACKLRISVKFPDPKDLGGGYINTEVFKEYYRYLLYKDIWASEGYEENGGVDAATRLAIVRVAAEIGRRMENKNSGR